MRMRSLVVLVVALAGAGCGKGNQPKPLGAVGNNAAENASQTGSGSGPGAVPQPRKPPAKAAAVSDRRGPANIRAAEPQPAATDVFGIQQPDVQWAAGTQ